MGGGGGVCLLLDYNKLPSTVNNQKPFTGTGASRNILLNKHEGGRRDAALTIYAQPPELGRGLF